MGRIYAATLVASVIGFVILGTSAGQTPSGDGKGAPKIELPELPPLKAAPETKPAPLPDLPKLEIKPMEPAKTELPSLDFPKPEPVKETKPVEQPKAAVLDVPKIETSTAPEAVVEPVKPPEAAKPVQTGVAKTTPCVTVEAIAPPTLGIGENLNYEIVVKNVGNCPVQHLKVEDELPTGSKFIGSDPQGEAVGDRVVWNVGGLQVGGEKRIKVSVKPNQDAEYQTKPTVTFATQATMQVRITRPKLQLEVLAPESATIGDEVVFDIKVTNTGNGAAKSLALRAEPSKGLTHPALQPPADGKYIEAEIAGLEPGESRSVKLRTTATASGNHVCAVSATTFGAEKASGTVQIQLHQPALTVKLVNPARCLVKAEPVFQLELASVGTSATQPVQLAAALPEGLEFVSSSDNGTFDTVTRTIHWTLAAQQPGAKKTINVKTRASAAGNLAVRAVAQAGPRVESRSEGVIGVEGVPSLSFEVSDTVDPVEAGKETTYEIKIVNKGTCACTNIRLVAAMTDGLSVTGVSAPMPHKVSGQMIGFDPLAKLAVGGEQVIRIKVKGVKPGDARFKAQLSCDQLKQPVVKEESTSFYQP